MELVQGKIFEWYGSGTNLGWDREGVKYNWDIRFRLDSEGTLLFIHMESQWMAKSNHYFFFQILAKISRRKKDD